MTTKPQQRDTRHKYKIRFYVFLLSLFASFKHQYTRLQHCATLSPHTTTAMGDDNNDVNADEVKARLRQKIRSQAEELLSKADSVMNKTQEEKTADGVDPAKANGGEFKEGESTADGKENSTADPRVTPASKNRESDELTKRLQKLALERQKQSSGERLKVIQSDTNSHLSSAKTFQELNLPKHLLDAIFAMGFDRPSAIQEEALPRILADPPRNVIGQAQSGSGKTAAFTLGMLYRTKVDSPATTQALCVTPTRELAIQIFEKAVKPMAANSTF